jgi:hypothetical protein
LLGPFGDKRQGEDESGPDGHADRDGAAKGATFCVHSDLLCGRTATFGGLRVNRWQKVCPDGFGGGAV